MKSEPEKECDPSIWTVREQPPIFPAQIWEWDLFGKGEINIRLTKEVNWWKRFWTKVFFGSKWKRL